MEDRAEVEAEVEVEAEAESSSSASSSASSSSSCESSSSSDSASVALSEITSALSPCGAMSCEGDESGRTNNGASVSSGGANPRNPNGHNHYRRVKFLCSFGGRILPRPLDGKLRYVGGETRIISVGRDICFQDFVARVSEICPEEAFVIKYQLPEEEDLDSLVSVLCDDDLANMMEEYDKLEATDGFTRLRVFLFPSAENIDPFDPSIVVCSAATADADGDQRYVDALNGVVMSMSRSESMNSLTNFADSVGSGSLPRLVTSHVVLPNSPHHSLSGHGGHSHSHHHVLHHHMSPPMSPHPISPLGHVMHSFEDSDVYHYQEQQQQQGWSVGGHYNISEMPASIGSNVPTYRDPLKPTNFSHAVPPEILQCDDHSRMPFNHKQLLKVYPANENYVGNSPEYNSPRDLQNHMDASNHWYEENHRPISDMLPAPLPYGHLSSQQQGPYTVSGYHVADTPRASDFGSPRFSQRPNVLGHACPQNRRPENMQHGDIHHVIKHSDVESRWHTSYHNQCDGLQRNNGQHYLKCCEGEGQWHNSSNYHECYDEISSEHMPSRSLHGKPVLQTAIPHAAIYEGVVRTEAPHPVIDDGHSRNLGSQKHLQTIWSQNYCSVAECNERHPDYTNVQSSGHMEYRNSHSSYRMYSRPIPTEEIGLPTDKAGIGQVLYEGNSVLERHYDRQITSEVNISTRLVEQVSSRDKVHSRRPEGYVHQPSCLLPKELAVRMENMNEEQLVPSVNKPNMDMGYEDRLDRARDWVMRSRNMNCDPIDGVCLPILTKVETVNNVSNYPPDHAWRCCYGTKTTVYNQDVPALSDKLQTVTPVEHLAHIAVDHPAHSLPCMHVDGTPMAPSHQTERPEEAIVGPNNILEIVAAQRKLEEYDIVHPQTSYKINPADSHNTSVYMSDDLSLKDAANVDNEVAAQKSLHIAHNIKDENPDEHPKLRKVIKGQELNVLPSLESKSTKNKPSCLQGRVPSRPEVLDTLSLPSTAEVLLSALSSSHPAKTDTQSPGPPIYDKSPENSIDLGQDDSGAKGEDEKEKETENLEVKDGAVQHLNEPGSMHVKTSFIKNSPNTTIEDAVNSEAVKYPESTVSGVANRDEGKHVPTESPKSGEELQAKELSRTSLHKKGKTGEKQDLKEKYLSSDDGENDISLNLGNSSLAPEIQARAKGLQIIKNDDLEDVRELGSGTYGTVYYGRWKGSDVAIKRIKASCFTCDKAEQEKLLSDFWKEARILSKLHHPNVVAFYGIVLDGPDGTTATVTEYMVNGSLKQVLNKKDRTIDRKKRIILAREAAFGMEYLHEKNIVHFDLKCDNLLVNMKDPQRPICKIGDLGLSKIKQRTLVSGGVRGTLPWMAPELLSGKSGMVTEKVDVFSFGIVMWELLTGEEPYAKMHCGEIIGGILNNTLRPEIPHWCEPSWRSLMERCWSPDPAERPSFSVIAAELRAMGEAINLK